MSRSTEKVKILEDGSQVNHIEEEMPQVGDATVFKETSMETVMQDMNQGTSLSYKDMVVNMGELHPEEIVQLVTEEVCPHLTMEV